jgi:integrase
MRFGELAGLHIEDLDFEHSIVHIRRSTYRSQECDPKTDAGYRRVNVDSAAMAVVKKHIGDRTSGSVFQSRKGTPVVHSNVNRYVLKPICQKLGFPIATTHAWRHGRISILQQNRVPSDLIKEWVGHTSLKTTSGYTHFDDAYRQNIVAELAKK